MNRTFYYTPGGIFRVCVQRYGTLFRAATNDFNAGQQTGFYFDHIEPLEYRYTEEEAQADLDALAVKLNLTIDERK